MLIASISAAQPAASIGPAGAVTAWPRTIPARVLTPAQDARSGVAAFALGDVRPPLSNAWYDPSTDELVQDDGRRVAGYYRDELGVRFYEPLDKTHHAVPPTGWCSWYYYYQEVSAEAVLANARWAAEHLADFGLRYIQVDDGWQGKGRGLADNRDWSVTDVRFEPPGMEGLARRIRDLGFEAGVWLVPYGRSDPALLPSGAMILRDEDGMPVSHEWVGEVILDPTAPGTKASMADLFGGLRDAGYTYFKTDGFPPTVELFEQHLGRMHDAPAGEDPRHRAELAFREGLEPVRGAIGEESYWLGCWGVELAPVGMTDGGRTAGDVRVTHKGYTHGRRAILEWAFMHNVAWFSDPDVLLVRPPLTDAVARSWATALGLSGQALLLSDNLPELPPARVEIIRRVLPATDVRSIDLYRPANTAKPVWTLTATRPDATRSPYTVVGVFNESEHAGDTRLVSWGDLGLAPDEPHHVFDFWRGEYLGAWPRGVFLDVPPGDVRLVSVVPADAERPVLLSTSRHVTQGWVDLCSLETARGENGGWVIRGRSNVVAGDPYTLAFGLPRGGAGVRLARFEAAAIDAGRVYPSRTDHQQGAATATFEPARTGVVAWEAVFEPSPPPASHPTFAEREIEVEFLGPGEARVRYAIQWVPAAGFRLALDGEPLGTAFGTSVILRDLEPGRTYTVSQRPVWYDGAASENDVSATFTVPED